jgi:hypothetical protein
MPHARFSIEEIGRRGQAMYERDLKAKVEANNAGKYLALDIETEDYEVGDDYRVLSQRLHTRHPDTAVYIMRIGSPAAGRLRSLINSAPPSC